MVHTHYDNLKVARNAPPEVIRAAYRVLCQKYHPDRRPGDEQANSVMAILNRSYAVLIDTTARAEHDRWIAEQERMFVRESRSPVHQAPDIEPKQTERPRPHASEASPAPINWKGAIIYTAVLLSIALALLAAS